MTGPAAVPASVRIETYVTGSEPWQRSLRAMASDVNVLLGPGTARPEQAFDEVAAVFAQVEKECTRFDQASDLMRANAAGADWCRVGPYCFAALTEAARAHSVTVGVFDPRVLRTLQDLGYDGSVAFDAGDVQLTAPNRPDQAAAHLDAWIPQFDAGSRTVRVGPVPIDLGGIGKGLAVRWAAERIAAQSPSFVIDAGGDCFVSGSGPDGDGWRVGVEDPFGGSQPVAVLALSDVACTTSSIRLRRWHVDGRAAHHLIDPRTGRPGGAGLMSVTVVGPDPATAEVWSKVLFLHGRGSIAAEASRRDLAAVWIFDDGRVGMSEAVRPSVIWQAP